MGEVAAALRKLIEDWHGRRYGSTKALAARLEDRLGPAVGANIYRRLHRELEGRPTWQVVEWIVEYCAPESVDGVWRAQHLAGLAGMWTVENKGKMPPGYTGRVVRNGDVVREQVSSSVEAPDPLAQARLLQQERDRAEQLAALHQDQVQHLREEVVALKRELAQVGEEASRAGRNVVANFETLTSQLGRLQRQVEESEQMRARLLKDNEMLAEREHRALLERDAARQTAEERHNEIQRLRDEANLAERRFHEIIGELEDRMSVLRSQLNQLHTEQNERPARAAAPRTADGLHSTARAGADHAAYQWMRDDDWLDPNYPPDVRSR